MVVVFEFLIGFFLGIIADWFLRDPITHWISRRALKMRFHIQKRVEGSVASGVGTLHLGNFNTNVCVIGGDGVFEYAHEDIVCRLDDNPVKVPHFLEERISNVATEEAKKAEEGLPHAWNGKVVHIAHFNDTRTPNDERPKLEIAVRIGQYYHFMVTQAALYEDFKSNGLTSALRSELIGDFSDWRFSTPPNMLNGLPVNLFVVTEVDKKILFSHRSDTVAVAPNVIAATINENAHPDHDYPGDSKRLDVGGLIKRALAQEIGWRDSEHTGLKDDPKSVTHILLFTIDTNYVAHGLLGYTVLPTTYEEILRTFTESGKDRFEISSLIPVNFGAESVCRYIHKERLYNSVGVGAVYSLVHRGHSLRNIQKIFKRLQDEMSLEA